jgi:hypothetical protein
MISLWSIGIVTASLMNLEFRNGHHWKSRSSNAAMGVGPQAQG